MATIEQVLELWFGGDLTPDQRMRFWFGADPATDALLRERFEADALAARAGARDDWASTPRGCMALLLLLDQVPRNIFRGSPLAFASDPKAQAVCLEGLALGHDRALSVPERMFFYLPLEHAEDLSLQERCVSCFESLLQDAPPAERGLAQVGVDYARRHHVVIARFGRFPHRNAVLGRASSPEERAWLAEAPGGF